MVASTGSFLHFEELDKQCAMFFSAKQAALKNRAAAALALECCNEGGGARQSLDTIAKLRVRLDAFTVISESHAALAHSCIALLNISSKKFQFLFSELNRSTQFLQRLFEEVWGPGSGQGAVAIAGMPEAQAKLAVHSLRHRLKHFLAEAQLDVKAANKVAAEQGGTDGFGQKPPAAVSAATTQPPPGSPRTPRTPSSGGGG